VAPQSEPGVAWTLLEDAGSVARAACERILSAADAAITARGRFSLVLAGGSTPELTYSLLANADGDWFHWHLYFGDERCLAADHPLRNSRMVSRALTERVPIPTQQIHPIPAERGPEEAACHYSRELEESLPFDLVLLGLGEDGHTASLFPGHSHPEGSLVLPVSNAPKPPADRVSLSAETLSNCRHLLFLVTGAGKREAVTQWRGGAQLPAAEIQPPGGVEVLIDRSAWPDP